MAPIESMPLAMMTTIGVGGPARWYVDATSADAVAEAVAWARARSEPLTILAGGSNVIVSDEGVPGLVVRICLRGVSQRIDGEDVLITAAAGEPWDAVVALTVSQGLAGIECLSGIPGTVGGTPIQNVGAYGQDVSAVVDEVEVFDRSSGAFVTLAAAACGFGYRTSRFKTEDAGRFVVCAVTFRLRPGLPTLRYPDLVDQLARTHTDETQRPPTLQGVRDAVLAVRARKGMVLDSADRDTCSVGSFFTNPLVDAAVAHRVSERAGATVPAYAAGDGRVKLPAAWLLERAGCTRGYGEGAVGLSSKHPLAIVNRGGATARAIVEFAVHLKRTVDDRFGVALIPEPGFVGFGDDAMVKYLMNGAA